MQKDDAILKELFSSAFADDVNYEGHSEDFLFIDKKLKADAFYKFSFTRFNLYYALAILSSVLLTASVAGHYFLGRQDENQKIQSLIQAVYENQTRVNAIDSLLESRKTIVSEEEQYVIQKKKTGKSGADTVYVRQVIVKEQIPVSAGPLLLPETDGASALSTPQSVYPVVTDSSLNTLKPKVPEKKVKVNTVKIIKQDTIIRIDSVKLKPKFPWLR
jgi:hypothetical protein